MPLIYRKREKLKNPRKKERESVVLGFWRFRGDARDVLEKVGETTLRRGRRAKIMEHPILRVLRRRS